METSKILLLNEHCHFYNVGEFQLLRAHLWIPANDESIKVLDTQLTPLLRMLEKSSCCRWFNHRFGLYGLVKENHLISYVKEFGIDAFNKKLTT